MRGTSPLLQAVAFPRTTPPDLQSADDAWQAIPFGLPVPLLSSSTSNPTASFLRRLPSSPSFLSLPVL
eukprot:NODE_1325_length_1469_cov_12.288028_g1099_i0.p10 GENE.NODE_1325_length_1469_cov_12.288028_g1099_i0~~NODE_1325_length_1469_cov_12.288028_g1099_i0.p10  ORF type:complete len:68 (-),score=4.84 NODE_1325_length_1469_cov_12.288028_g1099_i0:204-407(-)